MKKYFLKNAIRMAMASLVLSCGFILTAFLQAAPEKEQFQAQQKKLEGAWRLSSKSGKNAGGATTIKIVQDGFFTVAVYNQRDKTFSGTYGGTYTISDNQITEKYEFNTFDSTQVGNTKTGTYTLKKNKWQTSGTGTNSSHEVWEKISETNSPLAGTWRITAREQNGQMNTMRPGARKTLKVLSGSRFQWIAFNAETGEFFGTGGGTYTAKNGKYTEHIEFFSRDSSRVGMQLSFNYNLPDGKWHHSGQSSTGKPINEVWERITAR